MVLESSYKEQKKKKQGTHLVSPGDLFTQALHTGFLSISVFGFADLLPQGLAGSLTPPY